MDLKELKTELEVVLKNKERTENIFYQLNGQVALLEDLIKREEEKSKEEPKKE